MGTSDVARPAGCRAGEPWAAVCREVNGIACQREGGNLDQPFRRTVLTACLLAATPALAADPWPTRPVTVICPFPPGISTDILTRAVAAALSDALGQQFVMENRPGANGNIGAGAAAKAAPDGYTFVIATLGPIVANKFMYKTMSYDPERAFAPVVLLGSSPLIIVGSPKIPPTNLRELVGLRQEQSGQAQRRHGRPRVAGAHHA